MQKSRFKIHVPSKFGLPLFLAVLLLPGFVVAYFLHSPVWIVVMPVGLIILMLVVAALPVSRKVTPEEWANELEMVLLGTHDPYGWDDATSIRLADPRLERIRRRLTDHLDPETPEQREELRLIIEDLRTSSEPGKVN